MKANIASDTDVLLAYYGAGCQDTVDVSAFSAIVYVRVLSYLTNLWVGQSFSIIPSERRHATYGQNIRTA